MNAAGTDSGNYESGTTFAVSSDGTKIAFESGASDLVSGMTGPGNRVFLRDLTTGVTSLVSAAPDGTPANAWSSKPVFSPDGTKIAFVTLATNLGPADTPDTSDIYVHDLVTATNALVTPNAARTGGGGTLTDFLHSGPVFSPDSAKLAFVPGSGNFGPTDTNGTADVYVRDLSTNTTTLVSRNASGTDSGSGKSEGPVFSPDSTEVAFVSQASNLGPTDSDSPTSFGNSDVYLRDLSTGAVTLVSSNSAGTDSGNHQSTDPAFSPEGSTVAYVSAANDLGPLDTNSCPTGGPSGFCSDVYTKVLATGVTTLISTNSAGNDGGNSYSYDPTYSADGSSIAFTSNASNLGPVDADTSCSTPRSCADIYVKHLASGSVTLVSGGPDGAASHGEASRPAFNQAGTKLVFTSMAKDMGPTDPNSSPDIYVRDLETGTTTPVSVNAAGTETTAAGAVAAITPSGLVLYTTPSGDVGPTDTNNRADIYIATFG